MTKQSPTTKDVTLMSPLELVQFSKRTLLRTPLNQIIHGRVLQESNDPNLLVISHGFCGCAVGTVALRDGEKYREMMQRSNVNLAHPSTIDWTAGPWAGWFFAAMSRVFEGKAGGGHHATDDDMDRVERYLNRIERLLKWGAPPTYPNAFLAAERMFGSSDMVDFEARLER